MGNAVPLTILNQSAAMKPATALTLAGLFDEFGLRRFGRLFGRLQVRIVEDDLVVAHIDPDQAALGELAEQQLLGQRLLHMLLDGAGERPRAHAGIVTLLAEPDSRLV